MSGPFGIPFGPIDPEDPRYKEFQEQMQEQHQVMHMQRNEALHAIEDLLQALTADQLKVMMNLMQLGIQGGKSARITLAIFFGEMQRVLAEKDKLCPACMQNHDEELASLTGTGEPEQPTEVKEQVTEFEKSAEAVLAETAASADEYNMILKDDGWHCKICGHAYVSLEDRMLKGKDECPGCEIKTKWG